MDSIKRFRDFRRKSAVQPVGNVDKFDEEEGQARQEIYWGVKTEKLKYLIDPMSRPKRIWNICMILLVFYVALTLPFEAGFKIDFVGWYRGVSYAVDALFAIDLCLSFLTTYQDPETHFFVNDYNRVASHYLRGWFTIDMLSIFPFEIFAIGKGADNGWTRSFRNVRLLRMSKVLKNVKGASDSGVSNAVRLGWMVIVFCMVIHWSACAFAGVAIYWAERDHDEGHDHAEHELPMNSWIGYYEEQNRWESKTSSRYAAALYWAAMSTTTVGYGDVVPQNNGERMINAFTMVMQAIIYAVIFGNIGLYVDNLQRHETNYQEAVGALVAYVKDISLPTDLQRKVLAYHDYVWSKNRGQEGHQLGDIPHRVQVEVAVVVHGKMMKSNSAFSDAQDSFINAAVLALKFTVCLPNEFVYQEREPAEDIYFIGHGQVGVFREGLHGSERGELAVLKNGAHFGEIPMLLARKNERWVEEDWLKKKRKRKKGTRLLTSFRLQSVRGFAYCDLWKLDYETFAELLSSHPLLREKVLAIARERIIRKNWYDDEALTHKKAFKVAQEQQKRQRAFMRFQQQSGGLKDDDESKGQRRGSRLDLPNSVSLRNEKGFKILKKVQEQMADLAVKVNKLDRRSISLQAEVKSVMGMSNANSKGAERLKNLDFREVIGDKEVTDDDDQEEGIDENDHAFPIGNFLLLRTSSTQEEKSDDLNRLGSGELRRNTSFIEASYLSHLDTDGKKK